MAENSGRWPGFVEENHLNGMFSVESHAGVDDYLPPELGDTNEASCDLYEQNCPYQRVKFSNGLQPIPKMFRLVEEFPEYRPSPRDAIACLCS